MVVLALILLRISLGSDPCRHDEACARLAHHPCVQLNRVAAKSSIVGTSPDETAAMCRYCDWKRSHTCLITPNDECAGMVVPLHQSSAGQPSPWLCTVIRSQAMLSNSDISSVDPVLGTR